MVAAVTGGDWERVLGDRLVDAVLLGVGRDLDPTLYGGDAHPSMTGLSPQRDAFEYALAKEALRRRVPFLGVCRGMQMLNVVSGGTL